METNEGSDTKGSLESWRLFDGLRFEVPGEFYSLLEKDGGTQ